MEVVQPAETLSDLAEPTAEMDRKRLSHWSVRRAILRDVLLALQQIPADFVLPFRLMLNQESSVFDSIGQVSGLVLSREREELYLGIVLGQRSKQLVER